MGDKDFRVEQTYGEIEEAIFDTAYMALIEGSDPLPPSKGEQEWAEKEARRIASHTVMRFDGADEPAAQQEIERLQTLMGQLDGHETRVLLDRAETAEAERDEAVREREGLKDHIVFLTAFVDRAVEAEAERDKLREALDEAQIVLESFIGGGLLSGGNREHAEIVLKLIRAALASTTTTPEESAD